MGKAALLGRAGQERLSVDSFAGESRVLINSSDPGPLVESITTFKLTQIIYGNVSNLIAEVDDAG